MGTTDERKNGKQSNALQTLRLELLDALNYQKATLGLTSFNKDIELAFSASQELCVLDVLLPGLRPEKGRFQTPAQAKDEMDAVAKATAKVTQEADEQGLVGKEREEHIKAAIDAVRPAKRTKAILTGSVRTDGYSIFQLALNGRTDRPESPCCQQPWVDDDDGHDGHDHMDGTSTKPKAPNPAQRNFYASQRLRNILKANKLFTNKGYRFVRIVGIDWGQRYMYGASSMLVDLRDFSYKLESNYVLSSGMAHAERIFQDWSTIDMPRQPTSRRPLHSRQQSMPIQTPQQAREPFGICAAMRTARHS
ncbi:hypothetical protein BC831DRAFT_170000 [Entophlyctis helioformis]|nr:hypothetical protein BC831DRAFT_170000 [Entophlyctis helioformis]